MYEDRNRIVLEEQEGALEAQSARYITGVMGWMCVGLFTTVVSAVLCLAVPQIFYMVYGSGFGIVAVSVAQLLLVMVLSWAVDRLSPTVATVLFMVYSAVTGLTLSIYALVFQLSSLLLSFGLAAVLFLTMALYGAVTHKDLTKWGSLLLFGLLGLILAGIVNFFLGSALLDFAVCCIGIVIFLGLVAYDTNKIKGIYQRAVVGGYDDESPELRKLAIVGALSLYLDFINLFLYLMRLLGRRRN